MHSIATQLGPVAGELLAAWSRLPKHDCVPERRSFDPMAIARILPVVSLLQQSAEGEWRFRLIGTEIERRWGRRLTGVNVLEVMAPALVEPLRRELAEVVGRPCGSWSRRRVQFKSGRFATIETLRLPLRSGDDGSGLILSCSGELRVGNGPEVDHGHSIVMLLQHRFFDIGAGVGAGGVLDDAASPGLPAAELVAAQ